MDRISILNNSRMARMAYDVIQEYLDSSKKRLLTRLLAEMKNGPLDPQIYSKHLGGIQALDDLESLIKKEILKGEKTEMELLNESSGKR